MSDIDYDADLGELTPDALDVISAIEQRFIASTQQPRQSAGLHHVVAAPRASSRNVPKPAGASSRRPAPVPAPARAPPPLNTEPRVSTSTFGWGENGKHHVPGNTERVVAHWNAKAPSRAQYDDDEPMEISIDEAGNYGLGTDDGGIIDGRDQNELRKMVEETQAPKDAAALQRRLAIEQDRLAQRAAAQRPAAAQQPVAPPVAQPKPAPPVVNRQFIRSASTGSHVLSRPTSAGPSRAPGSHLPAIPSQSSQSGSAASSQGAVARRSALELESALMREQALKAELEQLRREKAASRPASVSDGLGGMDERARIQELQNRLYTAQGEATQARRAEKEAQARHEAEKEKMRAEKVELEEKLKLRDIEHKQRIESTRTKALFDQHHAVAIASTKKVRIGSQLPASQRPASPHASPSKKHESMTPLVRTKAKPRAPQFGNLHNAFNNVTPVVTRPKRLRTEEPSPTNSPSRHTTPLHESPTRSVHGSSPVPFEVEPIDWQPFERSKEADRDVRGEVMHHLFNHVVASALQTFLDHASRPTIYRILHHRVQAGQDEWDAHCSTLLVASSDPALSFEASTEAMLGALVDMVEHILAGDTLTSSDAPMGLLVALIHPISLLASTLLLFPTLLDIHPHVVDRFATVIHGLTTATTSPDSVAAITSAVLLEIADHRATDGTADLHQAWNAKPEMWLNEWTARLAEAATAVCLGGVGQSVWHADQLAVVMLHLASPKLDRWADEGETRVQAVAGLFLAAASQKTHFKALTSPVQGETGDVPVIDRTARYLVSMPIASTKQPSSPGLGRICHDATLTIIAAFAMLTVVDPDAHILIADRSVLIPALLTLLAREGQKVWGMDMSTPLERRRALELICPTLILLHALVYPAPRPSSRVAPSQMPSQARSFDAAAAPAAEPPAGIDLARRLQEAATGAAKEFAGLQHVFVSCMGAMAYGDADDWDANGRVLDKVTVQYLAQDLLEAVIEGPEGDALYGIYASPDDDAAGADVLVDAGDIDEVVYAYAAMDADEDN
ncbi:hypothetical protein Q5752_006084 [Cryptotrichosporon argae]